MVSPGKDTGFVDDIVFLIVDGEIWGGFIRFFLTDIKIPFSLI